MGREELGPAPDASRPGALLSADGWVAFVVSFLSRLYLGLVFSLALIALLPNLLGWHGTVVQSGSMEPHISAGDVVLAGTPDDDAPVALGTVVEFTSPASAEPSGVEKTRLHRIVAGNPDGTFVTAGDANTDTDSTPLAREQITGQARLLIPMIGLPGLWLAHHDFPSLALWSVGTLLALAISVFTTRTRTRDGKGTSAGGNDPGNGGTPPPAGASRQAGMQAGAALGILAALIALASVPPGAFSSAAFTASAANTSNTFAAAADWTPPTVTLADPGAPVQAGVTLTADAADAQSGIRSVRIDYASAGTTAWTTICTATTPPYTCSWNTGGTPDGAYTLRAVATNGIDLVTSSEVATRVANAFTVVLADPGEVQRGTVNLATALSGSGTRNYSVRVEYSPAGADRWSALCTNLVAPYDCAWTTTGFANDYYDLRAVATSGNTTVHSETLTDILTDNSPPSVTMTDPGTPLSGTRTLTATAVDAHSGIAQTQIQYARSGTATWTTVCAVDTAPYSCRLDTTTLPYGIYGFRAIATDIAGNSTTSAAVSNRLVDNTIASVSVEDPGAYLTGTARLNASANSTVGISRVRIQTAPSGTATWTTRCTLVATPYSCDWDTRSVVDGLYDLRAVLTDTAGRETISALVAQRRVDNSPLRGTDIQTTSTTTTPGTAGPGDSMVFTYSQPVNPATVTPTWNGAALPVTVRLRDGSLVGLDGSGDTIDVQRSGAAVNLGSVNLRQNYVRNRRTVTFNATMTATSVIINGGPRTVVTVTLGTAATGAGNLRTTGTPAAMIWTPSTTVATPTGIRSSNTPATESGAVDRDF
ncbi:Ig-like domain-containing protein [Arthrobacter sp. B0490]|uniref:Ig-like domain-containing protein n=1 Tax=Arthrobacter sp. B0490 TaxID=2058891 RepID=UPI000CE50836|nr:Ig-like domain-containing protein [Arthrobacter sp. B0490]